MKLYRLLAPAILVLALAQCKKKEQPPVVQPSVPADITSYPTSLCGSGGFPQQGQECDMTSMDFVASYGTVQNDTFVYDSNGRLIERYFYYDGNFNSKKVYQYDASCSTIREYFEDAPSGGNSVLGAIYVYENQRLEHLMTFNNNGMDTSEYQRFFYTNGKLTGFSGLSDGSSIAGTFVLDALGNVLQTQIRRVDGITFPFPITANYQYSSVLNPHQNIPESDFHEWRYFGPSVCSRIEGSDGTLQVTGNNRNLLDTHTDNFSQGVHTTTYSYDCP